MKVSRGVDPSIDEGVEKMVFNRYGCREAIEEARTFSIDPPGVEKASS